MWKAKVNSGVQFLKHGLEHLMPFIFVKFWSIITFLSLDYKTKASEVTEAGFFYLKIMQ